MSLSRPAEFVTLARCPSCGETGPAESLDYGGHCPVCGARVTCRACGDRVSHDGAELCETCEEASREA